VSRALSRRYVARPPPGYEQSWQLVERFAHTATTCLSPVALTALFGLHPTAVG